MWPLYTVLFDQPRASTDIIEYSSMLMRDLEIPTVNCFENMIHLDSGRDNVFPIEDKGDRGSTLQSVYSAFVLSPNDE